MKPCTNQLHFSFRSTAIILPLLLTLNTSVYATPSSVQINDQPQPTSHISIPETLGKIDESFVGVSGKTIIYIQDAHDSLEAQENIAKMIRYLVEDAKVKTVYEEGYEGLVPTDKYFGSIQDAQVKEKVSYFLLDKLRLGGAEYAHINRKKNFKLLGIDNNKLHRQNIKQYQETAKLWQETGRDLVALQTKISKLADQHFPRPLKEWMKWKDRLERNQLSLLDYIKRLNNVDDRYPNVKLMLTAESSTNAKTIEQLKAVDSKALFQEIDQIENNFADSQLNNERDKRIFEYFKKLQFLKRLNSIELSSAEFEVIGESLKKLKTEELANFIVDNTHRSLVLSKRWENNVQNAIRFYEIASQRDGSVERRLIKSFSNSNEQVAVLVFGGFHQNAIKQILRKNGISYHIITPKIQSSDERHKAYYKQLMSVGHYPFELPTNVRIASRVETTVQRWDDNPVLARAELRIMTKVAEKFKFQGEAVLAKEMENQLSTLKNRNSFNSSRSEMRIEAAKLVEKLQKANTIDEAMRLVIDNYPEMSWLTGSVNATPEGISSMEQAGFVSERIFGTRHTEFDRTALGIMTFLWVIKGDYEKFTAVQDAKVKLSRESFNELKEYTRKVLGKSPDAFDALVIYTVINDLGKIKSVVEAIKSKTHVEEIDHDKILTTALENSPEISPSFQRLSEQYKKIILRGLKANFNLGQFIQAENVPASLVGLAGLDQEAFDFYLLHVIYDIAGAAGHVKENGSLVLTEPTYQGMRMGLTALKGLEQGISLPEVYDNFLSAKAEFWGLNIKNPEERAVARISIMLRLPNKDKVQEVLTAFNGLSKNERAILTQEFNVTGLEDRPATLLYYAPATLANAVQAIQKEQSDGFKTAVELVLKSFARVLYQAWVVIKDRKDQGVFVVDIAELAELGKTPREMSRKIFDLQPVGNNAKLKAQNTHSISVKSKMQNLNEITANRIVPIGIGGGSDAIQAAVVGRLLKKHGKDIPAVISVRSSKTQSKGDSGKIGEVRTIENHGGEIANGVFIVLPNSKGSGRFLENIPAGTEIPVFLIVDQGQGELTKQIQAVIDYVGGADSLFAVDTGGDALYSTAESDQTKATPDQDLRVLNALKDISVPTMTLEIAVGVDSPANADDILERAKAVFYNPTDEDTAVIQKLYKSWEMTGNNESRYGKTAFAWQNALENKIGFHALPLPTRIVLDNSNPWHPFVYITEAMRGIFFMKLEDHLQAIATTPASAQQESEASETNRSELRIETLIKSPNKPAKIFVPYSEIKKPDSPLRAEIFGLVSETQKSEVRFVIYGVDGIDKDFQKNNVRMTVDSFDEALRIFGGKAQNQKKLLISTNRSELRKHTLLKKEVAPFLLSQPGDSYAALLYAISDNPLPGIVVDEDGVGSVVGEFLRSEIRRHQAELVVQMAA